MRHVAMKLDADTEAWELDDAEVRHRDAPDCYSLPALAERIRVGIGDRVDLFFLLRGRDQHGLFIQSERLSVTVREVSTHGYAGTLDTAPGSSTLLRAGDSISFELRHITSIQSASATESPQP